MDKNMSSLKKDMKEGKQVVLFLGAGINYSPQKHLLWNDVLSKFLHDAIPLLNLPPTDVVDLQHGLSLNNEEFTTETKVSVIKNLLGGSYVPLLQNIIYNECNHDILKNACDKYLKNDANIKNTDFYTLFSVAEFILNNDNIKAVVTYNYDNFLTEAITLLQQNKASRATITERWNENTFHPIDFYSGWTDEPFLTSTFLIYHIHGYIQPPVALVPNKRNKVVMSLEEFYDNAKEVFSWQTATQIHFLTHYTCIYIGTSFNDMTMQRMQYFADIEHNNESIYYLTAKGDAYARLKNIFFENSNHLKVITADNYQELYNNLLNRE